MSRIDARLLGRPSVNINGVPVSLPYRKAEALFYYLLLKGQASRPELTELLWADAEPSTALKNLRHAVYSVRKLFPEDPFAAGERSVIRFSKNLEVQSDAERLRMGDAGAWGGELLSGFSVDSASYEEWLETERRDMQMLYQRQLLKNAREEFSRKNYDAAERLGLQYIKEDPYEDEAAVLLMQTYYQQGMFRKALGVYHELQKRLAEEFSIAPLRETTSLYYKITNDWNAATYRIERQTEEELLGKEAVLHRLLAHCGRAGQKRECPGCLIEGRAGVGKTYLLEYILRQYDFSDRFVCRASCYPSEKKRPFASWNTVMMTLISADRFQKLELPEEYRKQAAGIFPCLLPEKADVFLNHLENVFVSQDYQAARESALMLFAMIAQQTPLVIVFEDIHWMDPMSLEFLGMFLRRLGNTDITVICTARDHFRKKAAAFVEGALGDNLLECLTLHDFTEEETRRFIRYALPDNDYTEEVLNQVYRDTGGNPLLLMQVTSAIRESREKVYVPVSPENIIAVRLGGLQEEERQILNVMTVISGWTSLGMLEAILTKDSLELMYLCDQLCGKRLLQERVKKDELEYTFVHEEIREILRKSLTETRLRILHLRAAQYLETLPGPWGTHIYEKLIFHYEAGGNRLKTLEYRFRLLDMYTGRCFELLPLLSQDTEMPRYAEDDLESYFVRQEKELRRLRESSAKEQSGKLDELEKMLLYAESRYFIHGGQYTKGLPVLEKLDVLCGKTGDREMASKVHLQFVYFAIQTYSMEVFCEHLNAGMALCENNPESVEMGSFLRLRGLYCLMRGENEEARTWLNRSIRVFEELDAAGSGEYDITIAGAYCYIAETLRLEERFDMAFVYYDKALSYSGGRGYYPGTASICTDYALALFQNGQLEKAEDLFLRAEALYESFYEQSQRPIALAFLAYFDTLKGLYGEAADRLRLAFSICERLGSPWWYGTALYVSWIIREYLQDNGLSPKEFTGLWPEDKLAHCMRCLEHLRRIEPTSERIRMEQVCRELSEKKIRQNP